MIKCNTCYKEKEESEFYTGTAKSGIVYTNTSCSSCKLETAKLKRSFLKKSYGNFKSFKENYTKKINSHGRGESININYNQLIKAITKTETPDIISYEKFIGKKIMTNCYVLK